MGGKKIVKDAGHSLLKETPLTLLVCEDCYNFLETDQNWDAAANSNKNKDSPMFFQTDETVQSNSTLGKLLDAKNKSRFYQI